MEFIEDFIGFHTANGFWVDKRLDLHKFSDGRRLRGPAPEFVVTWEAEDFKIAIAINGLILLNCHKLASQVPEMGNPHQFGSALDWWDEFLDYAYALQIFLESASILQDGNHEISVGEITPDTTTTVGVFHWEPITSNRTKGISLHEDLQELNRYAQHISLNDRVPSNLDLSSLFTWPVLSRATLECALKNFESVFPTPQIIKWLSFIARSKIAYTKNDFRMAFVLSWFVIESSCVKLAQPQFGKNPQKKWTPSINSILQQLHGDGIISPQEFNMIDQLRLIRNSLIHTPDSSKCTQNDCQHAGGIALNMAMRGTNIDLMLAWKCGVRY